LKQTFIIKDLAPYLTDKRLVALTALIKNYLTPYDRVRLEGASNVSNVYHLDDSILELRHTLLHHRLKDNSFDVLWELREVLLELKESRS